MITVGAAVMLIIIAIAIMWGWSHFREKYFNAGYNAGWQEGWKACRENNGNLPGGGVV
jgi:hypothetical protein